MLSDPRAWLRSAGAYPTFHDYRSPSLSQPDSFRGLRREGLQCLPDRGSISEPAGFAHAVAR
jgi:hypothetical protein